MTDKPSSDEDIAELRAQIQEDSDEIRTGEVIVAHRIGFWSGTDPYQLTQAEIDLADEELEAYVQRRIGAATDNEPISGNEWTPGMQIVRRALDLQADFLDDLGEHDEAESVRARIVRKEQSHD